MTRTCWTGFCWLFLFFALAACESSQGDACDCQGEQVDDETCVLSEADLAEAALTDAGVWQSAPWASATVGWTSFPDRTKLVLPHPLGRIPTSVEVYLSFYTDGASSFLASGDLARIMRVDADSVTLANNTNECFYVRLVLE
jgi:hypothetical protein